MDIPVLRQGRRFRPTVVVGSVPGELIEREGSIRGTIRVIEYDGKTHSDQNHGSLADLAHLGRRTKVRPRRVDSPMEKFGFASASSGSRGSGVSVADSDTLVADNQEPLRESTREKRVVWINIDGVGDVKQLKELGKMFDIHPLALEDVVNVHQHAKLECYGETLFFVVRMPADEDGFQTEQVSIFLLDGIVITVQERPGDCFGPLRHRIANQLGRIRKRGADYLAYAIIDAVVDAYFPILERYGNRLDEMSQHLHEAQDRNLPLRLHEVRAELLSIRKIVNQHRTALNDVVREGADVITGDTSLYFRDCQDHLQQLMEAADTDRETCGISRC